MDTVTVNKSDLLAIIEENRAIHESMYNEAMEGFKESTLKTLEAEIKKFPGNPKSVMIHCSKPTSHLKDYDRVIHMLNMHNADHIEISQSDFAKYVEDDWEWKRQWMTSNSSYSLSAADYLENS